MASCVVTGASRGIGLGIASHLAASGRFVVAIARSAGAELEAAARAAELSGAGRIAFVQADLARIEALPALVRRIRKEFGPIGALVNNAGIGPESLLATMPDDRIAEVLRLNVEAPIVLTKYVVRAMMADAIAGRVVNVSSIVATTGYKGLSVYSASKAALEGFTGSLAREIGRLGITVNAVAPGFIDTAMTRGLSEQERERIVRRSALGRAPDPEDVARAVEYLLGEGGRCVTGSVMTIDGGTTA